MSVGLCWRKEAGYKSRRTIQTGPFRHTPYWQNSSSLCVREPTQGFKGPKGAEGTIWKQSSLQAGVQ